MHLNTTQHGSSLHPFDLSPTPHEIKFLEPNPEKLQGWSAPKSFDLTIPHPLAPLLEFELLRSGVPTGTVFSLRGPAGTLGRYTPTTGPVDIDLSVLEEYERLHIGMPHIRVGRYLDAWRVETITPYYPTFLDGRELSQGSAVLENHAFLVLGDVTFRVRHSQQIMGRLTPVRPPGPCLRLKREGAPTSAHLPLRGEEMTAGRYSPRTGPVDLDLSHLPDNDRVNVSRRHARFWRHGQQWCVAPLGKRPVFINRQAALSEPHTLVSGDEVALGNVQFLFVGEEETL